MQTVIPSIIIGFALAVSAQAADVSTTISDVHLCCESCVKGVTKAVAKVHGVKADSDMDAETITLKGSDTASVQKAADALIAAGYFGKSSNPNIKMVADSGATGKKQPS